MDIRWSTLFLDIPAPSFAAGAAFWSTVTGSTLSSPRGPDGEFATLLPVTGDPYLRVQRVRGRGGNHLDLHVGGDLADAVREAAGHGAGLRTAGDDLALLDSPGGFTFCLVPWTGEEHVPLPVGDVPGRVDQLCLDVPADAWAAELAFWSALTGWPPGNSGDPAGNDGLVPLKRPPGLPLRLLLQRRDSSHPADRVTGHVDIGTGPGDQADRLADEHTGLGARTIERFPGWTVMADPVGAVYCLTRRPAHGSDGSKT